MPFCIYLSIASLLTYVNCPDSYFWSRIINFSGFKMNADVFCKKKLYSDQPYNKWNALLIQQSLVRVSTSCQILITEANLWWTRFWFKIRFISVKDRIESRYITPKNSPRDTKTRGTKLFDPLLRGPLCAYMILNFSI